MSNVKVVSSIPRGTQIAASGWKLAVDLAVEVEFTEKYVIATNAWVDEYGHGSTKSEAVEDLLASLLDLYESLREQQQEAQLAEELVDRLGKLESLLDMGE